jgi:hypothetical protein
MQEVGVPAAAAQKMLGCMDDPGMDQKLQQNFNDTAAAGVLKSATIQVSQIIAALTAACCCNYIWHNMTQHSHAVAVLCFQPVQQTM